MVESLEQSFALQTTQVVAYSPSCVGRAERHQRAEMRVGHAVSCPEEKWQRMLRTADAWLPEFQRGRRLPCGPLSGLHQVGQLRGGESAIMGERFGLEDPTVDVIAEGAEVAQVRQPPSNVEVVRVI